MQRNSSPSARRRLRGLVVVNGAMLLVLAAVTFAPNGFAQARSTRGEYTMVAGTVKGAVSNAVYVVDTKNQELMALAWDPNRRELIGVGYRNLVVDSASVRRRGRDR